MFKKLDLFLLDRIFDPFSIRLFKRWGVGNFTIAKMLIMIGTAMLLFLAYKLLVGDFKDVDPTLLIVICIIEFYWATMGIVASVRQEARWRAPKPGMVPDNLRDSPRQEVYYRRLFLTLLLLLGTGYTINALITPGTPAYMWRVGAWLPILAGFYFLGCTPPGPRDREEREVKTRPRYATSRV